MSSNQHPLSRFPKRVVRSYAPNMIWEDPPDHGCQPNLHLTQIAFLHTAIAERFAPRILALFFLLPCGNAVVDPRAHGDGGTEP